MVILLLKIAISECNYIN